MPSTTIMEHQKSFIGRAMKWPSIWARLSMRAIPPKVELKGWGNNVNKVALVDLQQRVEDKTNMSLSSQRYGKLYKFEEILHIHKEV